MTKSVLQVIGKNFLGEAPTWYKFLILGFLVLNPLLLLIFGPFLTGWVFIIEFILTLAMALKCYPLQPGGLLAIEAIFLHLTTTEAVFLETKANFQVVLLLVFMVASINFMKDLLMLAFSQVFIRIKSKIKLSIIFTLLAALLSSFLDALTVTAVIISVGVGFYGVYHRVASGKSYSDQLHDIDDDTLLLGNFDKDLEQFRAFLRSIMMHSVVGTALGGVCTLVGEPQNLLIAERAGWGFGEFFLRMAPVTIPVLIIGIFTCYFLEKFKFFGYGINLPSRIKTILHDYSKAEKSKQTNSMRVALFVQVGAAFWLVIALAMHLAEVGLIGLSVIIIITAFSGITSEHKLGKAFEEPMPFAALIVVFFATIAIIHDQHLFKPIIDYVLAKEGKMQIELFYLANGLLSMVSDNVFVATIYIEELFEALQLGAISKEQFDLAAVAINAGTNIPSVATPNGQAAFLFLLTSAIAPSIKLSYGRMVWMAIPYTVTMSLVGFLAVAYLLPGATKLMGM